MTLKSPNLDDRNFQQLVEEAKLIIRNKCPQWTDLSPGDPGIVLLELFAHLTETMIYRLNRLPEKAYVEFLRLIGVQLNPPEAASAKLSFKMNTPPDKPVEIKKGTRVTIGRAGGSGPPPVFVLLQSATIPAGKTEVEAVAYHCDLIAGEDAGKGTGLPGFFVTAQHPPIVDPTNEDLELIVGVEATPEELTGRIRAIEHDGQAYAIWREVDDFSDLLGRHFVYIVDRMTGTITFAPALQSKDQDGKLHQIPQPLADVPKAGRQIRLWYCSGGGLAGNVAAETLTILKEPISGVTVTNPKPATGGSDAETLDNALVRGPLEFHSLQRAVTARDFELLALRTSGKVARAKAFTRASLWKHALPGVVGALLVPAIPEDQRPNGVVTVEALKAHESDEALADVAQSLNERRPLGTMCLANWVRYKKVRVEARAVVHRGEDPDAVQARVIKRLHQTINPLPSSLPSAGWPFGQPLRASNVYDIVLAESGVSFVEKVRLVVDEAPETNISALAADVFQPHTWYAAAKAKLFRSMDDADGWELINRFPDDEETAHVRANPLKPGQVAVVTNPTGPGAAGSLLYVSDDCGETWRRLANIKFAINDLAWTSRQADSVLLLATDNGLYEVVVQEGASPVQILVDAGKSGTLGFWAIAAAVGARGTSYVAVAARSITGPSVYFSVKGAETGSFLPIGLKDEDVRVLEMQQESGRIFLWAGTAVRSADAVPHGVFRWELSGGGASGFTPMQKGWDGGSCRGLAFTGSFAYAATYDKGVLWLDLRKADPGWRAPLVECGLKLRDDLRTFQPVTALAADPRQNVVMAGGVSGICRSSDDGTNYEGCSSRSFQDKVTLSETRLLCSDEHDVKVVNEDEAR